MDTLSNIAAAVLGAFLSTCAPAAGVIFVGTSEPRDCNYGFDLDRVARYHKSAWTAALDGTPLSDSELLSLADAQSILECLAAAQD